MPPFHTFPNPPLEPLFNDTGWLTFRASLMPPAPLAVAARGTAHPPGLSLATRSKEKAAILLLTPPPSQASDEYLVQFGQNHSTLLPNSSDYSNVGNAHKPNQGSQSPSWNFPSGELKESEKSFSPN